MDIELRDRGSAAGETHTPDPTTRDETASAHERAVLCRVCGSLVTRTRERIEVDGRHEHTFFNPAGVAYRILCFRRAPGCAGVGIPSEEFTWFAGHRWQVALCRACGRHLGWLFSGASEFAALIVGTVVEGEE